MSLSGIYANSGYTSRYSGYSSSRGSSSYADRTNRGTLMKMAEYNIKNGYTDKAIDMLEEANVPVNSSIFSTIQQYTDNSLVTGLKEGVPVFGLFANSNSEYEAAARLTGTEVPVLEKIKEGIGAAASGAASGAAIGAGIGTFLIPETAGISVPFCTGIGAIIGGVTGVVRTIIA